MLIEARKLIKELVEIKRAHENRYQTLSGLSSYNLNRGYMRNGRYYYSVRTNGDSKTRYLGGEENDTVLMIKEQRYLGKLLKIVDEDIALTEEFVNKFKKYDYDAINEMLPRTYRGAKVIRNDGSNRQRIAWKEEAEKLKNQSHPYMAEGLKVTTCDGNYVRSKSEALIYNYLYSMGITFAYEKLCIVGIKKYYPDFTLLSEVDCKSEILIEHQGLMSDDAYRNRFQEKVTNYWKAGYTPGVDVFFTFDSKDGGLDISPIRDIINTKIRPMNS